MKILISAIGKLNKKSPESELINNYIKKTTWPVSIKENEEKKSLSGDALKEAESRLLMACIPIGAKIIVLDERGKELSSKELAQQVAKWRDNGIQNIVFLIGGANGHTEATRKKADLILSFGRMTMPHMLARVILTEQIYRIKTILDGHPYHRE